MHMCSFRRPSRDGREGTILNLLKIIVIKFAHPARPGCLTTGVRRHVSHRGVCVWLFAVCFGLVFGCLGSGV